MSDNQDKELRAYVERWRLASAKFEELRRKDLRNVNVAEHIEAMNGAFEAALSTHTRSTSGLVEQPLASEVQSFRQVRGWRFFFIGGIALQRWGEPRLTVDIDITILTRAGQEAQYIAEPYSVFSGCIPAPPTSRADAECSHFSRRQAYYSPSLLAP